ncbi:MAG: hypothetical protein KA758_07520 [Acidimicrobiales bacterium]|nr:hypothetical protein [Acidimicrobiales bacterium]
MFRPTFWQVTVDRAHARTHPESRDLIARLLDVIASLTAAIRRTDCPALFDVYTVATGYVRLA